MAAGTLPSPGQIVQSLNDLKRASQDALDKAQALEELAEKDGHRNLTADEQAEWDSYWAEHERCEAEADRIEEADQRAARALALKEGRSRIQNRPSAMQVLGRSPLTRITSVTDMTLHDPKRGFAHMGEFFNAVYEASIPGRGMVDERLLKMYAASGMNQGDMTMGGALVPPSFSQAIWDGMNQNADNLMALCDVYTVVGESLTFPAAADSTGLSRYGGVQAYWIAEGEQKTASSPRLRQIRLEPQELAVVVYATDKLLRNASALDAYIRRASTDAILFAVNNAILFGSGVGQPLGVMNSPALITVPGEGAQDPATVNLENVNAMYARLHPRATQGARWFINKDVEQHLDAMVQTGGTWGIPVFIASPTGWPNVAEPPQRRLKGLPLQTVEYCEAVGTPGDIILANLGFVAVGVQGGIMEDMSIHVRFLWDETAFRFVFMMDAQPILSAPITPFHGANTLSAYIALAAR